MHNHKNSIETLNQPFFILGVPRSGTTLLAQLLDGHTELYLPERSHTGHLFIAQDTAAEELLQSGVYDFARSWKGTNILSELPQLPTDEEGGDLADAIKQTLSEEARQHGKKYWGDKAPPYLDQMGRLSVLFPGAKFIHIVRDPRATAASLRDRQYTNLELAAEWWSKLNTKGIQDGRHLGSHLYHRLRFEDLLTNPEKELSEVCTVLEIDYQDELLQRMQQSEETNRPGAYVQKRINPQKINSWENKLSKREISRIERQAPRLIEALGYSLKNEYPDAQPLSGWRKFWLQLRQAWALLWTKNRKVVKGRTVEAISVPLGRRLKKFISRVSRLLFSVDVIHIWKR